MLLQLHAYLVTQVQLLPVHISFYLIQLSTYSQCMLISFLAGTHVTSRLCNCLDVIAFSFSVSKIDNLNE